MATLDNADKVADGDQLDDGFFNDTSGVISVEAGENISAGNAVYIHLTNGKAYVSDTGTADDIRANGIALNGISSGSDVNIQTGGVYTTSGLSDKQDYYLGASGAISTTLSGVRIGTALSTTALAIDIVQDNKDTIGTIKAWHKSFTGMRSNPLTAFWKECDGSALSDAESEFNGQNLPDLLTTPNGFLRGNTTSGGTGGSTSTGLITSGGWELTPVNGGKSLGVDGATAGRKGDHTHVGNEPPYMDVVWIIKIK